MIVVVLFGVAAAVGSLVRSGLRGQLPVVGGVPSHTWAVNVAGSFALGLLVGVDAPAFTIIGTAGIGSLTTFSTFAGEAVDADSTRDRVAIVAATVVATVGAAWVGLQLSG